MEPDRAQKFMAELTSRDAVIHHVEPSVMNNISVLAKEDLKMRHEAQNESETLDLSSLLKLHP